MCPSIGAFEQLPLNSNEVISSCNLTIRYIKGKDIVIQISPMRRNYYYSYCSDGRGDGLERWPYGEFAALTVYHYNPRTCSMPPVCSTLSCPAPGSVSEVVDQQFDSTGYGLLQLNWPIWDSYSSWNKVRKLWSFHGLGILFVVNSICITDSFLRAPLIRVIFFSLYFNHWMRKVIELHYKYSDCRLFLIFCHANDRNLRVNFTRTTCTFRNLIGGQA